MYLQCRWIQIYWLFRQIAKLGSACIWLSIPGAAARTRCTLSLPRQHPLCRQSCPSSRIWPDAHGALRHDISTGIDETVVFFRNTLFHYYRFTLPCKQWFNKTFIVAKRADQRKAKLQRLCTRRDEPYNTSTTVVERALSWVHHCNSASWVWLDRDPTRTRRRGCPRADGWCSCRCCSDTSLQIETKFPDFKIHEPDHDDTR